MLFYLGEKEMDIVQIKTEFINYLRQFDNRVCFNKEWSHTRPYVGVLFKVKGFLYFAPLTSSGKGSKLFINPKKENKTFFPIDNCKYGGVNLNNMIPVIPDVYTTVDYTIRDADKKEDKSYKYIIIHQKKFLEKNEKKIKTKANILYQMKTTDKLYPNYDAVTCDFKLSEEKALMYLEYQKKTKKN